MTIGLQSPSSYYMELINRFPPRPITNEAELIATQNRINSILDKENITQDDRDYLKVLGTLVYDYEEKYEPMPTLKGTELLKALLEESNLQPKDLIHICGSESTVLDILNGKRQLTENQVQELAAFFQISPHHLVA
ncbi:transcriptional regulator [Aetokthonos hydrillicola Thurmond2011]|uniref:Transcriptional regulator n=1 Tax=Aetokthonos hydrillicola Thurmond2011 TaxID=2712845 RepID=A0AAP5I7Y7_9CYAN|nr:transcriptional regulator [Aetokthonos hydrillicola]MBO3462197.1 transcriptional regulator [Aetokthonos hydrillicola CCALA 1050]MBW4585105.1 transcriptional regulator [Aetokthonos hydrillicola CCALA 1050]MDR9894135.1 transcriptional regulator [Aetokthonos hydrillicola Thurmond2011]